MSADVDRGSKEPAEQVTAEEALSTAKEALIANPGFKADLQESQSALCAGFLPWLEQSFPEPWDPAGWQVKNNVQIMADIEYVSGYKLEMLCPEIQESYASQKQLFDAFAQENFRRPEQLSAGGEDAICFHCSSRESVDTIWQGSFDFSLWGQYGNSGYVSTLLSVALAYSQPDDEGCVWAAYGCAHLGTDIPVCSKGQTDFGVRDDNTRHVTLTNPQRTYYYVSDPLQFVAKGYVAFSIRFDQLPSDFSLRYMYYSPALCRKMTECMPVLVAYNRHLLEKGNMQRELRQNSRQELKLQQREEEDEEGGSAAKRTRGA
jgi:hypothetical protein